MPTYHYCALKTPEQWRVRPTKRWRQELLDSGVLCNRCGRVKPTDKPHSIDVWYRDPIGRTLWRMPDYSGMCLYEMRLWKELSKHLADCGVGRALDAEGNVVATHVTAYTTKPLRLRWRAHEYVTHCPECGWITVYFQDTKPSYVMSYDIQDRPAALGTVGQFYCRKDIAESIDISFIRRARWYPVEVVDVPRDGLIFPGDPPGTPGQDVRSIAIPPKGVYWF